METFVDGFPSCTAIVRSEGACGRNRNVNALRVAWIENDRMQAHATRAGLPCGTASMTAQAGKFLPRFAAIFRTKQRRVFHPGVDSVRFAERGLKVPNALEFPRVLRAVVPHMRGKRLSGFRGDVVDKFVALTFGHPLGSCLFARRSARLKPGLAAVVGAFNDLAKPAACLRGVDSVRVQRRPLHVVNLPAGKM